jgi:retinol dehydrogenase-12
MVHNLAEGYKWLTIVNVISTWSMALLLLPLLRATKIKYYTHKSGEGDDLREGNDVPHLVAVGSNAYFYTNFEAQKEPSIFKALRGGSDMLHRHHDTKLISLFVAREVASRMLQSKDESQVVLNMVEPGYCQSQLLRDPALPWYTQAIMAVGSATVAHTSEQGSRTYISAATAGWKSHGIYQEDCELSTPHEFVDSEEDGRLQTRVYGELMGISESGKPGISQSI